MQPVTPIPTAAPAPKWTWDGANHCAIIDVDPDLVGRHVAAIHVTYDNAGRPAFALHGSGAGMWTSVSVFPTAAELRLIAAACQQAADRSEAIA